MVYKTHFYIDLAWRTQYVGVFEMEYQGVTFYFIDNEFYFSGPKPYSWIHEDIEKFAFFSKAAAIGNSDTGIPARYYPLP